MNKYIIVVTTFLSLLFVLCSCQNTDESAEPLPGYYWQMRNQDYSTEPIAAPYMWFYSDKLLEDSYSYGQILTNDGWENVFISWQNKSDMIVCNAEGDVVIAGRFTANDVRELSDKRFISMEVYEDSVFGLNKYTFSRHDSLDLRVQQSENYISPQSLLPATGYWCLNNDNANGEPLIWFHSDRIFGYDAYNVTFGAIYIQNKWHHIQIEWENGTDMIIKNDKDRILISGHLKNWDNGCLANQTSFTIYTDKDIIFKSDTLTFVYTGNDNPVG